MLSQTELVLISHDAKNVLDLAPSMTMWLMKRQIGQ